MVNHIEHQYPGTKPRFFYGYIVVIAAFIIQLAMFGSRNSFGVFFKPMMYELDWSRALVSGAFSISLLMQGLFGVFMGALNDRLGPRIVLTLCGILIGAGFILMSQINAAWQLYLFYVALIGIGMGGLYTPPMSTVARWFVRRRSVMTGIVVAGGGVGGFIMPPIVNWLISEYGWRDSYIIMGAVVTVIVILLAQCLRRDPAQIGQEPYGKNMEKEQELDVFAAGFSLKGASRTRQFWMIVAILFCFGFCIMTITVHIVPHATDLEISAATAANILSGLSGAILVGGILLGVIADRIGNRQAYAICLLLMAAALFWALAAREVWTLFLVVAIFGIGGGGAATLVSPLTAELFGMRSHGLVLGVLTFCATIGGSLGSFIAGYIFDVKGSYQLTIFMCATLAVIGLILTIILRPVRN
jgi:MFS family permease